MIGLKNKLDAVIIGGGLGSRLKKVQSEPKLLTKFGKNYNLDLIINNLKKIKINNIHVLCGKDKAIIKKYIKKKNINLYEEKKLLGTAGCLTKLNKKNLAENLLIIFGDLLFQIDLKKYFNFHLKKKSDLTILSHPSDHLFDSDIIDLEEDNKIKKIFFKPHKKRILTDNLTMAGIFIIKKKLLSEIPKKKKLDFSKFFLRKIISSDKKVFSYSTREYCKDFGTPQRLKKVRQDHNKSYLLYYSSRNKLPAVFLDRDGVLNKDLGPNEYSNPLNFLANALKALKKLRNSKYLIVLVSNQSGVAKGFLTLKQLKNSFKKYQMFLSKHNFYFDKIYFCPHHPTKGFIGENLKYKIICKCRKPKPGMLLKAKKDLNIDLANSYFIGDNYTDFQAAIKAKVMPILVKKFKNIKGKYIYKKNVLSATNYILKNANF